MTNNGAGRVRKSDGRFSQVRLTVEPDHIGPRRALEGLWLLLECVESHWQVLCRGVTFWILWVEQNVERRLGAGRRNGRDNWLPLDSHLSLLTLVTEPWLFLVAAMCPAEISMSWPSFTIGHSPVTTFWPLFYFGFRKCLLCGIYMMVAMDTEISINNKKQW